jgi:hypothetical protein
VPRALSLAVALTLAIAACGSSSSPTKQAEELESVAAEGALLAHDAAEGDTTSPFTTVHARALGELAAKVERAAATERLERLARTVGSELARLERSPSDRHGAASVEQSLEDAAKAAERLAAA